MKPAAITVNTSNTEKTPNTGNNDLIEIIFHVDYRIIF